MFESLGFANYRDVLLQIFNSIETRTGTELAYTKTPPDTKEGAVFPAPFRFKITCIILITEDALVT